MVILGHSPPPQQAPVVMAMPFYNGSLEEGKRAFAPLLSLGPIADLTAEMPYPQVNTLADDAFGPGRRWYIGAANCTAPLDAAVVQEAANLLFAEVERVSQDPAKEDMRGSAIGFELLPNAKMREVPPHATAFASRGAYFNVATILNWLDESRDQEVREFNQRLTAQIRARGFEGDGVGGEGVGQYNNYAESAVNAAAAFGGNAKRLQELKKKWDPYNRFDKSWKMV